MPGRVPLVEGENYLWDGKTKLVSLSDEASEAMQAAIEIHAWPFIAELASWDNNNPDSKIINFVDDETALSAAIDTLSLYTPWME